jgi:beta-lactamase class A
MQSVFKIPIAMYILNEADHDRVDLGQSVNVTARDLAPGRSPMASTVMQYGRHSFTVRELLGLMIEQSDNTAADILLHNFGGPSSVQKFLQDNGTMDVDVSLTERQMAEEYYGIQFPAGAPDPRGEFEKAVQHEEPAQRAAGARKYSADMRNTATAVGGVELLTKLQSGKILSRQSTALLFEMMTKSLLLPGRLKGLLPPDAVVAHKPGTSDTTGGVTAATNDVGVITLPDKSHLAVAVVHKGLGRRRSDARVHHRSYDQTCVRLLEK